MEQMNKNPCPKCGSVESSVLFNKHDDLHNLGDYTISECKICGMWYRADIPEDLSSLYPSDFAQHNNIPTEPIEYKGLMKHLKHLKDITYSNKTGLVPELVPRGNILEIGCGHGYGLIELRKHGWINIYGNELVESAALSARDKGFVVDSGCIENVLPKYPDNYFDVVLCYMVMEHLINPFEVSKLIAKKLKPGGKFLFSTTQRTSVDYSIYKDYWAGFDMRHMVFFRKIDLIDMLKDDFENIKFYHQTNSVDFYRPSESKIKDGKGNRFDKFILSLGWNTWNCCLLPFALLDLTSRVSVHCTKKK